MESENTNSIPKEVRKEYVELNIFDCKSCGHKGFESATGNKHEETCLSKTAVFLSKAKINQSEENNKDHEQFEDLQFFLFFFIFLSFFMLLLYSCCLVSFSVEDSLVCGCNLKKIDLYIAPGCLICGSCGKILTRSTICYHVDNCFRLSDVGRKVFPVNFIRNESVNVDANKEEAFPLHFVLSNVRFELFDICLFFTFILNILTNYLLILDIYIYI